MPLISTAEKFSATDVRADALRGVIRMYGGILAPVERGLSTGRPSTLTADDLIHSSRGSRFQVRSEGER
jgi:hypothetical protein